MCSEAKKVIHQCHDGVCSGHFAIETIASKILASGYYSSSLLKDIQTYCSSCTICQDYGRCYLTSTKLQSIFPTGPFEKWGVDFVGLLPKTTCKN